jgi:hypothetical protein
MEVILKLSERVVELSADKTQRTEQIETIGEAIDHLWDVLDVAQVHTSLHNCHTHSFLI